MKSKVKLGRREFIKAGTAAGGGLMLGFYLPAPSPSAWAFAKPGERFAPNAFVRISPDGTVTCVVGSSEMGQGVLTSLSMILADELDADWSKVRAEQSPAEPAYANPLKGVMRTSGSMSVRGSWTQMAKAGAAARAMLIAAAAKRWGVPPSQCDAKGGEVVHPESGRKASYGELAEAAAGIPVPTNVALKGEKDFNLIGKPIARLDVAAKVNGSAIFGIDVAVPGMLYAVVARCPTFGGRLKGFDGAKAKAIAGVRDVVPISSGVAVVADHFWTAKQGRDELVIDWDYGPHAGLDSAAIRRTFAELANHGGEVARNDGDVEKALSKAAHRLEAAYWVPYLAHAPLEPMNCTAHVSQDRCEIWVSTQAQTDAQQIAARITGLPTTKVSLTTTFLGSGLGRRLASDYVAEAVELSKTLGTPVKVIWTREDDMQHDFYRPAFYNLLRAGLDPNGQVLAWSHRMVGASIMVQMGKLSGGLDEVSVNGAANLPYGIPNIRVEHVMNDPGVPIGFWRSVANTYTAFAVESFIDELASAAERDPYEFRFGLLANSPRHRGVLALAARKAGWGKNLPEGRHQGIAVHYSFGSYVAQVAEVSVSAQGKVRVHRVVCAVDCGRFVNPNTIAAQVEGAVVQGLTALLQGEITLRDGRVVESNFDTYPLLRMNDMPQVEVHIVRNHEQSGGIGEPGVPPVAPAVTNAIFAATGKRLRTLPIYAEDLARA